jgi:GNAT superfamily N-acetyltransferase
MNITDMTPEELNFVANATKLSLRNSVEYRDVPTGLAFAHLNPMVNRVLNNSAVLVAKNGNRIMGFSVFEVDGDTLVVHFLYTRQEYRRQGVARALLQATLENAAGAEAVLYSLPTTRFAKVAERYGMILAEGEGT